METSKQQLAQFNWVDLIFVGREISKLDSSGNEYGKQLLNLCITTKLWVINGITRRDIQGYLRYIGYQCCITVCRFSPSVRNDLNTAADCLKSFYFRLNFTLRSQTSFT